MLSYEGIAGIERGTMAGLELTIVLLMLLVCVLLRLLSGSSPRLIIRDVGQL
jgi:hypothetical protein